MNTRACVNFTRNRTPFEVHYTRTRAPLEVHYTRTRAPFEVLQKEHGSLCNGPTILTAVKSITYTRTRAPFEVLQKEHGSVCNGLQKEHTTNRRTVFDNKPVDDSAASLSKRYTSLQY